MGHQAPQQLEQKSRGSDLVATVHYYTCHVTLHFLHFHFTNDMLQVHLVFYILYAIFILILILIVIVSITQCVRKSFSLHNFPAIDNKVSLYPCHIPLSAAAVNIAFGCLRLLAQGTDGR